MRGLVVGGGIAGLSWLLYNPSFKLITDKVGGQFVAPFHLGPKYLHKTQYTERLLKDISLNVYRQRIVKVGFYSDNVIKSENTEENRRQYFEKTRGLDGVETYQSSMSEGSNKFEAYDVGVDVLIDALYEKVKDRVVIDRVNEVNLLFKDVVCEKNSYPFDLLVVTVAKPLFCRMIRQNEEADKFVSYPTTFVKVKELPKEISHIESELQEFDYVYFSQKELPFHRVTRIENEEYCIEFKGDSVEKQRTEEDRFVLKIGQLIQRKDTIAYPSFIKFFGRYANWQHNIKTKELIEELLK